MTQQTPMTPTLVKNQLIHPDGSPRRGEKVDFLVRAYTDWRGDEHGRMVGSTATWTNVNGLWRACLLPWPAYEAGKNTIVEVREGGVTSGFIQVPETSEECWMRKILVDPPAPSEWRPIARLGDLHDVDKASLAEAPDGAVLIKRGGMWTAEVPTFGKERLAELDDVDPESMSTPQPGDELTYLGTAGWGIFREKRTWLTWRMEPHPSDPQGGRKVLLTVTSRRAETTADLWWDDEPASGSPTPFPPGTDTAEHVYTVPDGTQLFPSLGYNPAIEGEDSATNPAGVIVPLTGPVEGTNEPQPG